MNSIVNLSITHSEAITKGIHAVQNGLRHSFLIHRGLDTPYHIIHR